MKSHIKNYPIKDRHDIRDFVKLRMEEKGNELFEAYGYVFNQRDVDMVFAMIETDHGQVAELDKDLEGLYRHISNKEYLDKARVELQELLEGLCLFYINTMWPVLIATLKAEGVDFEEGGVPDDKPTLH